MCSSAWKLLCWSGISDDTALYARLDEVGSVLLAAKFYLLPPLLFLLCIPCAASLGRSKIVLTDVMASRPVTAST